MAGRNKGGLDVDARMIAPEQPQSPWPALPEERWPVRHREAWRLATHRDSPGRRGGHAAGLAPATRRMMVQFYGQFLGWLQINGRLDPGGDPVTQMSQDLVARFIAERHMVVSDSSTYNNLRTLTIMMNCLAAGHDWTWIWQQGGAPRRPTRLFPAGLLMHRLVSAMQDALAAPNRPPVASRFRDHLFVAVAVSTALRSRNLREMRLGLNLVRRKIGWEIIYDGSEVKNGEAILGRLPPVLDPSIERYIEIERLRLLKRHGRATDQV